jgi:smad nuclear-interacting protein 1
MGGDSLQGLNKKERQNALKYEDSSKRQWGLEESAPAESKAEEKGKDKANFGLTGALAKDEATGNMLNGVVLKFSEPLDSSKPDRYWRFYVFKDDEIIETLHVAKKSVFLFGKDVRVADVVLNHPSISRQHAVLQYRSTEKKTPSGKKEKSLG